MRRTLLIIAVLFFIHDCYAQEDTIKKRNRLTQSVVENFYVLKTDKSTKQGLYQAIYRGNIALASGLYHNNKRVGLWHFYTSNGKPVQNFDYNHNTILFEEPDDTVSQMQIRYSFDDKITPMDRVTIPVKVGGRCYGYIPYLKMFRLSDDYIGTDLSQFVAVLEILVSPGGRLADFKVHIRSDDYERITTFSTELIDADDRFFVPATINDKAVLSRIFVRCRITDGGELDVY